MSKLADDSKEVTGKSDGGAECEAWIPVLKGTPSPFWSVPIWVVGGPLHHGEDYIDVGVWNDRNKCWQASAGEDDVIVVVSHWMDYTPPSSSEGRVS